MFEMSLVLPPKPRLKRSWPDGRTTIWYNNEVNLPANLPELIEAQKRTPHRVRQKLDSTAVEPSLIEVVSIAGPYSDPSRVKILTWNITELHSQGFTIQVHFEDPLYIS